MLKKSIVLFFWGSVSLHCAAAPVFYRGVNIGGPAVTINGNRWDGDDAAGFTCNNSKLVLKNKLNLKASADEEQCIMLHSFRWGNETLVQFHSVQPGLCSLWLYVVEDNNPEQFDISIQGVPVLKRFNSGKQGTWRRIGPFVADVKDGSLTLSTRGGAANLCGIELWKGAAEGVKPVQPPRAPLSPFVGKFADQKPRVVVMTDIGGDPDDRQSMVRYLLYTCDFETEGFCTGFGCGHDKKTRPDLVHKAIDAYGKVVDNLQKHRKGYPRADALHALVQDGHNGDPHKVGPGMDSDASEWIIKVLQRDDPRPVWFPVWGGPRELAQALWKMDQTLDAAEFKRLKAKIRVYSIADQDKTAGWIKENHPDVFYLYSQKLYRGIWSQGNQDLVSEAWLKRNVLENHGPLGAPDIYPVGAAGKKGVKEGDTPSYLYLIRNGLSDPEAPGWGGWGGRFEYSGAGSEFLPASDMLNGKPDMLYTIWRWRQAFQNEFEARMDWCVKPYEGANHSPLVVCNGVKGVATVMVKAKPGEMLRFSAAGSSDPDNNALSYRWTVYPEAGTYKGTIKIDGAAAELSRISVPADASGRTIHVILEVTDNGTPPLTAYRRVVIGVK